MKTYYKKRILKALKISLGLLAIMFLVLTTALFWPMPKIHVPIKTNKILIKSVNVIDVKTGKISYNRNVWIEGYRISMIDSIETAKPDANVLIIDATDKFLIPGLWDMHTHSTQHSPWLHHPLYIANGVTAIRDMSGQLDRPDSYWAGTKDRLGWNEKLDNYKQATPRYVLQSSFQINGENSVPSGFPEFFKVLRPKDVISLLNYYEKEGADFIKVYADIPAESYRVLVKECARYNIHLAGHKPLNVSLKEAIVSGQRSFEHGRIFMFDCFPDADSLLRAHDKVKAFRELKPSMIAQFDTLKAGQIMELMSNHNSHWTPTLQTVKMSAYADDEEFINSPYLDYIPTIRKALFWMPDISRSAKDNISSERIGINKDFYESVKLQVAMAHRKGVPIMVGTDVTDTYVFPGFSLHTELEDLAKTGMSNLEVLRSATLIPARYSSLENELGSIGSGKLADLVLLQKNPLDDIRNTREIAGVILNGNYYDQTTLNNFKKDTKALASSFHMNVKFAFSFLNSPLMRKQIAD